MKKFIANIMLFSLVNVGIFIILLLCISFAFGYKHWATDPDVFIIPENKQYDLLFLGTSHAEIFTRFNNQKPVEIILGKTFFNLAQPDAGPVMEKIYLEYFLQKKNSAKTLVYFLDPHVFYSTQWNENYYLLPYGKLELPMLHLLFANHISPQTITDYMKTYLSLKWFIKKPRPSITDTRIASVTQSAIRQRLQTRYPDGENQQTFEKYAQVVTSIIQLAKLHNMNVVFIVPTTLLNNQPGMNNMIMLLKSYQKEDAIPFFDFSHAITDPTLYSDVDHLNSRGITVFTKTYLSAIL